MWVLRGRLGPLLLRRFPAQVDAVALRMIKRSSAVPLLLLTTIGRRTGEPRTTPLLFLRDEGRAVVLGSNYGRPRQPNWSRNLVANPKASIQVNGSTVAVTARPTRGDEWERLWNRMLELWPGWKNYERRTSRQFQIFVLEPSLPGVEDHPAALE